MGLLQCSAPAALPRGRGGRRPRPVGPLYAGDITAFSLIVEIEIRALSGYMRFLRGVATTLMIVGDESLRESPERLVGRYKQEQANVPTHCYGRLLCTVHRLW